MSSKFKTIANGLKLVKIHRAIKFSQKLYTRMRRDARNRFEKDFWMLLINSIFGKCMKNVRTRVSLKLIELYTLKNLMAIHQHKETIKFDIAIYVESAILDVSKTFMYDFHYNVMKNKYNNKIRLLYSDTVSLIYNIRTLKFFNDIRYNLFPYFDTSNYPKDHFCFSENNINQPGYFKDEMGGKFLKEFVSLRTKLHAYVACHGCTIKTLQHGKTIFFYFIAGSKKRLDIYRTNQSELCSKKQLKAIKRVGTTRWMSISFVYLQFLKH
ncbi:Uncharacterized protein FWK35_00025616 [Aphis craccivora]|uniref:Uncharacterized protein n=1 Tax=Aphis craccivora TaxID=307492 RepID=A0A6G0VPY0_APHCR|nr:Uncharacterized protein FWK35_00025616 [Aphis craccivora]